jgi:hypothetical protein
MILVPFDPDRVDALETPVAVGHELLGRDTVLARILAEVGSNFAVPVVDTEDPRPLRPGVVVASASRGLRQQLEVGHRERTVTKRRADTVVTSVTTTDYDHYKESKIQSAMPTKAIQEALHTVLPLRTDVLLVLEVRVEQARGVELKELHGKVDTIKVAVRELQVARPSTMGHRSDNCVWQSRGNGYLRSTSGKDKRIVRLADLLGIDVDTNVSVGNELDTLVGHEVDTTLDDRLVELHVGDTVRKQSTEAVVAVIQSNSVAGFVELIGSGETCRTSADDSHTLPSAVRRRLGLDPPHLPSFVNNGALDPIVISQLAGDF